MDDDKFRDELEEAPGGGGGGGIGVSHNPSEGSSSNRGGGPQRWSAAAGVGGGVPKMYKREMIRKTIIDHEPGDERRSAVINALRDMGVKVFIIEAKSIETTGDIFHHVNRVIDYVSLENQMIPAGSIDEEGELTDPLGFQRCLLYQDRTGRLFNLVIAEHAVGPTTHFEHLQMTFSILQAVIATTILCRSYPCATNEEDIGALSPGRLVLILGMVFTEELSLAYTFAQMYVRATPSLSAHTLTSFVDSDVLNKAVILALAMAPGADTTTVQGYVTIGGISGAIALFLCNLGSRSWRFMGWRPLTYRGPFSGILAFFAAIGTGICFPYLGHRKLHKGGRPAVEHVVFSALVVAIAFLISDFDKVQSFLVVGSQHCNQDYVNIVVGGWWALSFIASLFVAVSIPSIEYAIPQEQEEEEPFLEHDHASPVGFRVPSLPNFEVDPYTLDTGILPACAPSVQLVLGVLLAVAFGGGIMYLGWIDDDDDFWSRRLLELGVDL